MSQVKLCIRDRYFISLSILLGIHIGTMCFIAYYLLGLLFSKEMYTVPKVPAPIWDSILKWLAISGMLLGNQSLQLDDGCVILHWISLRGVILLLKSNKTYLAIALNTLSLIRSEIQVTYPLRLCTTVKAEAGNANHIQVFVKLLLLQHNTDVSIAGSPYEYVT